MTCRRSGMPATTALLDEAAPAEPVEQRRSMPGVRASRATTACSRGVEQLEGVALADGADHRATSTAIGSAPGSAPALVERRGDDAHAAVGGLDDALAERRSTRRASSAATSSAVERHRLGVDDEAVDELGDLVDGGRQDPPGDDQRRAVAAAVLDAARRAVRRASVVEEVGVVDDERPVVERGRSTSEAELAAQPDGAVAGGTAHAATTCRTRPAPRAARRGGTSGPVSRSSSGVRGRRMTSEDKCNLDGLSLCPGSTALIRSAGRGIGRSPDVAGALGDASMTYHARRSSPIEHRPSAHAELTEPRRSSRLRQRDVSALAPPSPHRPRPTPARLVGHFHLPGDRRRTTAVSAEIRRPSA